MKKLWDWAWDLYRKHEEGINYLIFGFLAFVLNYVLYFVFASTLHMHYMAATALSWVLTVVFAYWTNRTFVFKSQNKRCAVSGQRICRIYRRTGGDGSAGTGADVPYGGLCLFE